MSIEPSVRVEDKLFYNRYLVDAAAPTSRCGRTRHVAAAAHHAQGLPGALL